MATEALPRGVPVPPLPPAPPTGLHKPGTAAVLSLILPGLGQIYNRDYLRGIFWLILTLWIGAAGGFGWPFHLISSYTAYRRARRTAASALVSPSKSPVASFLGGRAPILIQVLGVLLAPEGLSLVRPFSGV